MPKDAEAQEEAWEEIRLRDRLISNQCTNRDVRARGIEKRCERLSGHAGAHVCIVDGWIYEWEGGMYLTEPVTYATEPPEEP